MFFFLWYPALMLTFEAGEVIDMRLRKVARSSPTDASTEINLMVSEKIAAAIETSLILLTGGTVAAVYRHYRNEVSANAARLSAANDA